MDESDAMWRAGCAARRPQKLQTGNGYARGGRVAMDRVEGKRPPAELVPVAPMRGAPPPPPRAPRRGR